MTVFDGSTNQTISDKETKVINGLEFVGNGYGKEDSIDKGLPTWNEKNIKNFLYLFSLISQKLNVSDIVDTLSSVDTNKPLSAKQGKALNDLISSLYTKAQIDSLLIQKLNISDIVDNLTSTATNKPLSAKQGKTLFDLLSSVYTKTETDTRIDSKIASLVGAAPESLNTLKEIADALADDDNQIAVLVNSISLKLNISDIVDNLTSTDTNKPLSAKQGKNLFDLLSSVYTKTEVNTALALKSGFPDFFSCSGTLSSAITMVSGNTVPLSNSSFSPNSRNISLTGDKVQLVVGKKYRISFGFGFRHSASTDVATVTVQGVSPALSCSPKNPVNGAYYLPPFFDSIFVIPNTNSGLVWFNFTGVSGSPAFNLLNLVIYEVL